MIAKSELEHGAYYEGGCRNTTVARWDATRNTFLHWREKFGSTYLEEIRHPNDESRFDAFIPEIRLNNPGLIIPFISEEQN